MGFSAEGELAVTAARRGVLARRRETLRRLEDQAAVTHAAAGQEIQERGLGAAAIKLVLQGAARGDGALDVALHHVGDVRRDYRQDRQGPERRNEDEAPLDGDTRETRPATPRRPGRNSRAPSPSPLAFSSCKSAACRTRFACVPFWQPRLSPRRGDAWPVPARRHRRASSVRSGAGEASMRASQSGPRASERRRMKVGVHSPSAASTGQRACQR